MEHVLISFTFSSPPLSLPLPPSLGPLCICKRSIFLFPAIFYFALYVICTLAFSYKRNDVTFKLVYVFHVPWSLLLDAKLHSDTNLRALGPTPHWFPCQVLWASRKEVEALRSQSSGAKFMAPIRGKCHSSGLCCGVISVQHFLLPNCMSFPRLL